MTALKSATDLLRLPALRELLPSPGPCITVLLPPYRPGEPAGSQAALLNSTVKEASQRLSAFLPDESISRLLEPLKHIVKGPDLAAGSHWSRVIFRSPGVFEPFQLTQPVKASLAIGGSFSIRPLLNEALRPQAFYILNLSKTNVALLRCSDLEVKKVPLPNNTPENLADALALEPPDHDLENRSSVGRSTGAMHSVRFGTGSGRETQHAHLADFYRLVDRAVSELLREHEAPLILAGVDEDQDIFRAISGCQNLVRHGVGGSSVAAQPGHANDELLDKAYSILHADVADRHAATLSSIKEQVGPGRFSMDPVLLLHAAFEGRIARLYLNRSSARPGVFERGNYHSWGEEDLLNLAAAQTLVHRGEALDVPAEHMPLQSSGEKAAALGIMRY